MVAIADAYYQRQLDDCRTRALTIGMSDAESVEWSGYLMGFTSLMTGCEPAGFEAPGGIQEFGLANLFAIDLVRPLLGRDDVELLIAQYLAAFCPTLQLSAEECGQVESHLWSVAEDQIDPSASATLSTCVSDANDAGSSDAGAGDASN